MAAAKQASDLNNRSETADTKQVTGFVHLHNHTHYSLLDGLQKIKPLLNKVEALNQSAVAITDHGTLSGAIEFYKECTSRGIKPIIGIETYVAPRKHTDKESAEDRNPFHLILLAKNKQGYQNLMKLSTAACLDGFYYKPRIDHALLEKYHDGLICLSGCVGGEVGTKILNGDLDGAREIAKWYKKVFGAEHYYLEMQPHVGWEPQQRVNKELKKIASELDLPLVATGDAHYTEKADRQPHEILLCVQTGTTLEDPKRMKMDMALNVEGAAEFAKAFADTPEALANTVKIAAMCNLEIELGKILIPEFETPKGETENTYLRKIVYQGAAWRYGGVAREDIPLMDEARVKQLISEEVMWRIEYELEMVSQMGYAGYFLIVADMINWAKNQGIVCGPGRGSAAGSIIAYVTNITDLDPIKYDLLFERFLNPERISMPDIDMDYADDRREEVIDYVTEKYGRDRVAQIITFGIMAARNAVRDTGRVLGFSYGEIDAIAKLIPPPIQGRHVLLRDTAGLGDPDKIAPDLAREYKNNPLAKQVIDIAVQLEGTIRNAGTHAAGVVIAPNDLVGYVPLTRASKGGVATQYTMGPVEELGLLKFDFLGLSNLTILKNALRIIKRVYNADIDLADIPLDDPKTFELLAHADTTGVFQLESAGMKRYLRDLKPNRFEDIIAMVALYRPGPMQWIDDFIQRKHNPDLIKFDHPKMEKALKETYGIIVYQEQVMEIARDLCGFTGGQSDTLRKGIGKKIPEVLAKMKQEFIEGAIKTSDVDQAFVEKLWKSLEDFAAYCFNKSHAACYALIALWTAYLKANYPSAFMAALMTSDYGDLDRIAIEVAECRKLGLELLPPDVNESYLEFAVVPETNYIRFGLSAIKNVGRGPIEAIVAGREDGPYKGIEDFARRVDASTVLNRKTFESLIKAGCFDSMLDRDVLLHNLDKICAYAARAQKNALSGQIDIFGSLGTTEDEPALQLDAAPASTDARERLVWERELLGLYLSRHPLDDYDNYLAHKTTNLNHLSKSMDGRSIHIGGMITSLRKITTKNGAAMAFAQLENKTGAIELIVFPRAFEATPELWQADTVIEVRGKINARDREGRTTDELKVMVDKAATISLEKAAKYTTPPEAAATSSEDILGDDYNLILTLGALPASGTLVALKHLFERIPGKSRVYLVIGNGKQKIIKLQFMIQIKSGLEAEVAAMIGDGQVRISSKVPTAMAAI